DGLPRQLDFPGPGQVPLRIEYGGHGPKNRRQDGLGRDQGVRVGAGDAAADRRRQARLRQDRSVSVLDHEPQPARQGHGLQAEAAWRREGRRPRRRRRASGSRRPTGGEAVLRQGHRPLAQARHHHQERVRRLERRARRGVLRRLQGRGRPQGIHEAARPSQRAAAPGSDVVGGAAHRAGRYQAFPGAVNGAGRASVTVTSTFPQTAVSGSTASIFAVPLPRCAVASPLWRSIKTTASSSEDQATSLVRSIVDLSSYSPVAVNCCLAPPAIDALAGLIVIDFNFGPLGGRLPSTVTVTLAYSLQSLVRSMAVTRALPITRWPTASPASSIETTAGSDDDQATNLVRSLVDRSA